MPEEELLPRLQTDLPLPEKELPPNAESKPKFSIFRNKIFIGFVIVSFLVAFLIGGFALGRNSVLKELNPSNPVPPPPDEPFYQGSSTPTPGAYGIFCGGIAGKACPTGYNCKLDGNYPDAGGTCVAK